MAKIKLPEYYGCITQKIIKKEPLDKDEINRLVRTLSVPISQLSTKPHPNVLRCMVNKFLEKFSYMANADVAVSFESWLKYDYVLMVHDLRTRNCWYLRCNGTLDTLGPPNVKVRRVVDDQKWPQYLKGLELQKQRPITQVGCLSVQGSSKFFQTIFKFIYFLSVDMESYEQNVALLLTHVNSRSRINLEPLWEATYEVRRHLVEKGSITAIDDMLKSHCPLLSNQLYVSMPCLITCSYN